MKPQQQAIWPSGEDLPLFTGAAPHAAPQAAPTTPQAAQLRLASCPVCLDTGAVVLDGKRRYCTCPRGQNERTVDAALTAIIGGLW